MLSVDIDHDTADNIAARALESAIVILQDKIETHADSAINGELAEDIQMLWHLMHAYNHLTPPSEHYDVPTP